MNDEYLTYNTVLYLLQIKSATDASNFDDYPPDDDVPPDDMTGWDKDF
jgi:hypothetical protein